ncbi:MAG: Transcriptional regulator, AcrR family [uncultured Pseudonocardia sp.]|uniref:Transcriptional regulator, AcrR family n=1 Tax=uncultured Pseudonocardia sp. TaxID=211455 RepID=A0A6J4PZG5_9PSEU|nr:MAG: Transcriptional regulator, AcrR family [uncultured Pseudonocardia sp.]
MSERSSTVGVVTSARTGRGRRLPPDERRAALVDATLPLVLRHGAGVSTRQIAEAAGVAEGTIFRVFPDKEALLRAVVGAALDPGPLLSALGAIDPARPLRARLVAVVAALQERLSGVFTLFDALGAHPRGGTGPGHQHPRALNEALHAAVVEVVGPDAGRLRVPPGELARLLRLLTFSATHPRVCDGAPLTAERVVDVLLDGVLTRPDREDRPC